MLQDTLTTLPDTLGSLPDTLAGTSVSPSVFGSSINTPSVFDFAPTQEDIPYENANFPSPFEAGIDMGHALLWSGAKSFSQAAGLDSGEQWFQEQTDINLNDATVPLEGLWDKVQFAAGTASVGLGGAVAAAVAAPFVGLSSLVGGTAAGMLAGIGMTAGDLQLKAEELDPEYKAGFGHVATATAIGSLDAFAIGKVKTILSPMRELIKSTAKGTVTKATGVAAVGKIAKDAALVGAAEGVQDLGTGLGANYFTGTEIDESRINALADSAVEEMIIGSILGVPISGLSLATENLSVAQTEFDENKKMAAEVVAIQDSEGNLTPEAANLAPVEGAVKQPGFFSIKFQQLTGNATAALRVKYPNNPYIIELSKQFNVQFKDRAPGRRSIGEKARSWEADLLNFAKPFLDATRSEQDFAWEAKAKGELDLENPIHSSLAEILDTQIPDGYRAVARDKAGADGLFGDKTYLPTFNGLDWKRMSEDPDLLIKASEAIERNTPDMSLKARERLLQSLQNRKDVYLKEGNSLYYGSHPHSSIETYLTEALADGAKPKTLKKLTRGIEKRRQREIKKSALVLQRELAPLGQDFFTEYYDKNKSPADLTRQHIRQVTEHAALIDSFGVDNSLFDELVARAVSDGAENGRAIAPEDITKLYDVLRTQQRIHLKPMTAGIRDAQNKARAVINMKLLGLATLVSIPESLIIALNTGAVNSLKGLLQTLHITPRTALTAKDLGMGADAALNSIMNRVGEESFNIGKWEERFFKATGLPHLQHFLTTWATRSQDIYIKGLITDLDNGKLVGAERRHIELKLAEAGINIEGALNWRKSGFSVENDYFKFHYRPALDRLVRDTIVDPNPIDKPLWMNDERFLLIAQLKGFMTAFTNRVMAGWGQKLATSGPQANREMATRMMPYVAMYISAQVGIQAVRELAKGNDLDDFTTEKSLLDRVWSAFGYMGAFAYPIDAINSFRHGGDPLASVAGPAVSITMQTIGGVVASIDALEPEQQLMKTTMKLVTPNVAGVDWLTDFLKEAWGIE